MLESSFCCFKGFSNSAEQKIWQLGCLSWQHISYLPSGTFSPKKTHLLEAEIVRAKIALQAQLPDYFIHRFEGADKVRVLKNFQDRSAVIDIETTGLGSKDMITTIALLKSGAIYVFVNEIDIDNFLSMLEGVRLLITFNGSRFDLPFLRRHFSIDLGLPHLDLMPVMNALGYKGGQKACEKFSQMRRTFSQGNTGMDAVHLWKKWKLERNFKALEKLVIYNAEDVFMLEKLAVMAYNQVMKTYPMGIFLKSSVEETSLSLDLINCIAL